MKKEASPILVTGIARSGGSMIAGAINVCGAFGGHVSVNKNIRRGMFENMRIREGLVKPYLIAMGADAEGQYPLPKHCLPITNWKVQVEKAIKADGYKEGHWMYKDSRMILMWQVWHAAFPNAKWVIVRRRTGDVVQSCVKTGFMKAFKDSSKCLLATSTISEEKGWLWWVHQYEQRLQEMTDAGINYKVIWPERMGFKDYSQMCELTDWLGLEWKPEAAQYIDALIWKQK